MESSCRVYRPRDPRKTPLYGLLDSLYDRVNGAWEERFERSHRFWRGLVDEVVARYLDCGIWESGFARVRCRSCPVAFLVAFSCKRRGLCPSTLYSELGIVKLKTLILPGRTVGVA